jgi:hypothetical protein
MNVFNVLLWQAPSLPPAILAREQAFVYLENFISSNVYLNEIGDHILDEIKFELISVFLGVCCQLDHLLVSYSSLPVDFANLMTSNS